MIYGGILHYMCDVEAGLESICGCSLVNPQSRNPKRQTRNVVGGKKQANHRKYQKDSQRSKNMARVKRGQYQGKQMLNSTELQQQLTILRADDSLSMAYKVCEHGSNRESSRSVFGGFGEGGVDGHATVS